MILPRGWKEGRGDEREGHSDEYFILVDWMSRMDWL